MKRQCLLIGLLLTATGHAQTTPLEVVQVTAQRRVEDAQTVPISIAVVDGDRLLRQAFYDADQLDDYVPDLLITKGTLNTNITVRGIQSGANDGFEQSVALGLNGLYLNRGRLLRSPIMDLERIEVLRGPQGVIYGKNTIAGAINVITRKPTDSPDAYLAASYESEFDGVSLTGAASGPLTDRLSGRLAFRAGRSDGHVLNSFTGRTEPRNEDRAWRGTLDFNGENGTEVTAMLELGAFDVDGSRYQIVDPGPFLPAYRFFDPAAEGVLDDRSSVGGLPDPEIERTDTTLGTIELRHNFGSVELTSVTGYAAFDLYRFVDTDFSPLPLLGTLTPRKDFEQIGQEVRFDVDVGERFDVLTGVAIQQADLGVSRRQDVNGDVLAILLAGTPLEALAPFATSSPVSHFDQTADLGALFAETTWMLGDRMRLRFGARWTSEDKSVDQRVLVAQFRTLDQPVTDPTTLGLLYSFFGYENHRLERSRSRSDTTSSVNFQYDLNRRRMFYASYASGFKSGGFNEEQRGGNLDGFEFDDEEAWSTELGAKLEFGNGTGRLNLAAFHSEFDSLQTSTFDGLVWVVTNAAAATSEGIELEGVWRPAGNLHVGGSIAFLDSRFDEHRRAPCAGESAPGCTQDLSGRTTNFAPDRTANLFVDFLRIVAGDLALSARIDVNYTDDYFFNGNLDPKDYQYAYTVVDCRAAIGADDERWELALIGRNLTDKRFPLYRINAPLMTGAYFGEINLPRTWAVQLLKRFG